MSHIDTVRINVRSDDIASPRDAISHISETKFEVYCWFRCHPWHYRKKYANVATGSQYGEKVCCANDVGDIVMLVIWQTSQHLELTLTLILNRSSPLFGTDPNPDLELTLTLIWHRDVGDFMLVADFWCWWKALDVGDVTCYQHPKLVTNIRHQHRCNPPVASKV